MKKLLIAVAVMLVVFCSPAFAHGDRITPDGPDAGHSIQYTAPDSLMEKPGWKLGIHRWNLVPGPVDIRKTGFKSAEVVVHHPLVCPYKGGWYGGVALYMEGREYMCISRISSYGTIWSKMWMKRLALHEWGHFLGIKHHLCYQRPRSIMEPSCGNRTLFRLTKHDRRYKRGYIGYF